LYVSADAGASIAPRMGLLREDAGRRLHGLRALFGGCVM
jgi:hypothetical protein